MEQAERRHILAWRTLANGNVWSYRMEHDGDGTLVTKSRQLPARRPFHAKLLLILFFRGTTHHDERMRQGMRRTLERLKTIAEAASSSS